jgi:pyruvate/2-oxoglutarate dehydrogenase complex dihydrolipoamide dehydrogenase (E3) component
LQQHADTLVNGTDLLVATGRTPNTKGIGLDQVGIEFNGHGYIKVNDWLETTAANVGAMGDCAGSPQFTHAAYNGFGQGAARVMKTTTRLTIEIGTENRSAAMAVIRSNVPSEASRGYRRKGSSVRVT